MKFKISLIVSFLFFAINAQENVFYFKDTTKEFSSQTIAAANFIEVKNNIVLEKKTDAVFWFKIPKNSSEESYSFEIASIDTKGALGYQGDKVLDKLSNTRYVVFQFDTTEDTYIKIASDSKAYFPISLEKTKDFSFKAKKIITYNGFYYGFSFLVLLYCFIYFFYFRDYAFLYYSLFLTSITLGFIIIDGTLNFYGVSKKLVSVLIIANYIALAFFSSKFVNNFLFLERIYPKLKIYTYTIGVFIILFGVANLFTGNHTFYIVLNILVFSLLFIYWMTTVILFKKNIYTKILAIAFVFLLFSAIDSLVITNFGFRIFDSNPLVMKIGGVIQIVVLWFAVIAREKLLRKENTFMKKEIINFSETLDVNATIKEETLVETLSIREREIFELIIQGKSNKMISSELNISINTVKFHVKNIYDKLKITSRKEAINY